MSNKCYHCDYENINNINMKSHILRKHSSQECRQKEFKYYCEFCDFGTFNKYVYEKHSESDNHLRIQKLSQLINIHGFENFKNNVGNISVNGKNYKILN
jgi:hypothetical protein